MYTGSRGCGARAVVTGVAPVTGRGSVGASDTGGLATGVAIMVALAAGASDLTRASVGARPWGAVVLGGDAAEASPEVAVVTVAAPTRAAASPWTGPGR